MVTCEGRLAPHPHGYRVERVRILALGSYEHWSRRQHAAAQVVARELGVELCDQRFLPPLAAEQDPTLRAAIPEAEHGNPGG